MKDKSNSKEIMRGSPEFKEFLREIKLKRIICGKDKKMLSDKRLTLAMTRIPNLKEILTNSEIKDEY